MPITQNGTLETLDDAECRRLLGTMDIGRLGFTAGAMPSIVPVPFAVHENCVFVPARRGDDLVRSVRGAVVVLEVDSYRDTTGAGWCVTVVGPVRVLAERRDVECIDRLHLFPRSQDVDRCFITLQAGRTRGWRAVAAAPAATARQAVRDREFSAV